jgi:hypothetical protein
MKDLTGGRAIGSMISAFRRAHLSGLGSNKMGGLQSQTAHRS